MSKSLVVSQKEDSLFAVEVRVRKGRLICSDIKKITVEDISKKRGIICVLGLSPFSYLRERVTYGPHNAILLQLQDRVERLGVFRKSPEIFYRVEKREGLGVECSVLAVESLLIDSIVERFTAYRIDLRSLIHKAVAVAFFVIDCLPGDNTLTVCGDEKECYIIITDRSGIRSIRTLRFDEFLPPSETTIREEIELSKSQYRQSTGLEITKVLVFGPLRNIFTGSDILPRSERFVSIPETIMDHPELAGAFLVPKEFNMLPKIWLHWNKHLRYAKKAAMFMLALAASNGALWGYLNLKEQQVKELINTKSRTIRNRAEELNREIPVEKLKFVDSYNQALEAFKREHRMDEFLARLIQIIPSGFKITKLSVNRASPQTSEGSRVVGGNVSHTGSVATGSAGNLNLILSVGAITDFNEAHRVFKHILDSLHVYYSISKSSFRFNEREGTAECSFELRL